MRNVKPDVLEALRARPSTKSEVRDATGLSKAVIFKWVNQLHAERAIHIAGWKPHPHRGRPMEVYAAGDKPDAPCTLPRLNKQQVYVRFRQRWDKTEKMDMIKARDRERYWQKKAASKKQHPFSALGL